MKNLKFLSIILLLELFQSCKDDINCTQEFRTIGITITGDSLTHFYTVRLSNSDTIRFSYGSQYPYLQWYPVLDDN